LPDASTVYGGLQFALGVGVGATVVAVLVGGGFVSGGFATTLG
jgi:hypothetical protein